MRTPHETVTLESWWGEEVEIDKGIVDLIKFLWVLRVRTTFSCESQCEEAPGWYVTFKRPLPSSVVSIYNRVCDYTQEEIKLEIRRSPGDQRPVFRLSNIVRDEKGRPLPS